MIGAPAQLHTLQELVGNVGVAGRRCKRRQPVLAGEDAIFHRTRLDHTRPADDARNAEAALVHRSLGGAERRHPAVRPGEDFRAVVCGEDDDSVVRDADIVQVLEQIADIVVELRHSGLLHGVIVLGVHFCLVRFRQVSEDVHACRVVPDEERLAGLFRFIHEAFAVVDKHFVECLHVVLGGTAFLPPLVIPAHIVEWRQGPFVDDALLADPAPARHDRGVIRFGRIAMHQVPGAVSVEPVLRVIEQRK